MSAKTLLLVEDRKAQREEGEMVAEKYGYDVVTAKDKRDAFRVIRTRPSLTVILTDIHLSRDVKDENKDGREIADAAFLENKNITIVGTSSRFPKTEVMESEDDGPFHMFTDKDWIKKPEKAAALFEYIGSKSDELRHNRLTQRKAIADLVGATTSYGVSASDMYLAGEVKNVAMAVIDNANVQDILPDQDQIISVPIPIWVKECQIEGNKIFYLEVYKFSAIAVAAASYDDALATLVGLFDRIIEHANEAKHPELEEAGISRVVCQGFMSYLNR